MRSTTIPQPPETEHEITAEYFKAAVQDGRWKQTEWFYRKKGAEIKNEVAFTNISLDDGRDYIVLIEARCFSQDENSLWFDGLRDSDHRLAFIFIKCILPGFILENAFTNDWVFIRTHMEKVIHMAGSSQIGHIMLDESSWNGGVFINNSSICEGVIVQGNSSIGGIWIVTDSKCGYISIDISSHCKDILIGKRSQCGRVDIDDHSYMGNITVSDNSGIESISVEKGSHAGDIKINGNSKCSDISIKDSSKCKAILLDLNSEAGDILIQDNSACKYIEVHDGSKCKFIDVSLGSQSGDILIKGESQSGNIRIDMDSKCKDIYVWEKSRSGSFWIDEQSNCEIISVDDGSQAGFILVQGNSQCKSITIDNNSKCEYIAVLKNSLSGEISVLGNSEIGLLKILGYSQSRNIRLDEGKANRIEIEYNFCSIVLRSAIVSVMQINNCHLHQLIWEAGTKVELYVDRCIINHLQLYKTSLLKDATISIINSGIYIIQLQELLVQGQLILRNIEVAQQPFLWMSRFNRLIEVDASGEDEGQITKDTCAAKEHFLYQQVAAYHKQVMALRDDPILKDHIKPLFRIVNSSLGKTEITGSDLTGFHFEYRDSRILEVFITGTPLPKEKIDIYNGIPGICLPDKIYFEQKISIYNQLKKIFENQGDIVEATWYHAKAMGNQERLLSLHYDEKAGKAPGKWWSEEAFDLFNFHLNKISNNHGESWRRALCFSFLVLFSIYVLYFSTVNFANPFSWSGTGDFMGNFFSFLDITHKIDFMVDKEKLNWGAKFLDFFGRVATEYCIYQFIAAFRRHGKKGVI